MKHSLLLFISAIMTLAFSFSAKSQVYSDEICFYAKAGESVPHTVAKIDGSHNVVWVDETGYNIKSELSKSPDFFEKQYEWRMKYEYDRLKSTSSREVYKKEATRRVFDAWMRPLRDEPDGYYYVAFAIDLSSIIYWRENNQGEIINKITYTRIPRESLMPKAANYDFLYD